LGRILFVETQTTVGAELPRCVVGRVRVVLISDGDDEVLVAADSGNSSKSMQKNWAGLCVCVCVCVCVCG